MSRITRSGDLWAGALLSALGAYIIVQARGWTYSGPDGPGAGFFPLWYGIAVLVLSLALVVKSALPRSAPARMQWSEIRRALVCWVAFLVCVMLINAAGFMLSFALLTWFIVAVMFRKSHALALAIAIGGAVMFQVVFDTALGVTLPLGFGL